MTAIMLVDVRSGATVGSIADLDGVLSFTGPGAEHLFRSRRRVTGWDNDRVFDDLAAGWSNGYVTTELDEASLDELDRAEGPHEDDEILRAVDRYRLRRFWTRDPRGLAKWADKPHPYTSLYRHLRKYLGSARAKRAAAQWFKIVFHIWPGERKGKNPLGPG
jgi:hypothetical protein